MSDRFVDNYLTKDDESVEEAKERLKRSRRSGRILKSRKCIRENKSMKKSWRK
ncbi:MAG: hypothetical protein K0R05_1783 [Anaerocolumna sp.]|jgi:hypothetical protein|nr:hypothetical protein [Anaerocolumna sp.]